MIQQIATVDRTERRVGLDSTIEMCTWKSDARTDANRHDPDSNFKRCQRCNGYNLKCPYHPQYRKPGRVVQEMLNFA